ncbi:Dirigent protein 19 [Sesamum alatum]|uniref:Dirigent protein n=1 Tax=Sesamum alatum TaxID=300844 RepID=A0AAE1YPD2_9LAMI|nr:Dirigent protein 19 [Sesamum alatum]
MGSLLTVLMLTATLGSLEIHADGRVIAMPGPSARLKLPKSFESVQERFSNLNANDYFILHYYAHDIVSGENKTAWEVAKSAITDPPTYFGLTQVVDNLLTFEPNNCSMPAGRVQGIRSFTDLHQAAVSVNLNFVVTWPPVRGYSVISVQGRFSVFDEVRELSIVGGTGSFTMVRGFALCNSYILNLGTGNSVYEYLLVIRREPPRV